ncbi:MAG: Hint domain-containing protein [Mucilaginibacter sp.]|uniref:Hint domain-containing protein n=1 Tax=Mucilaginibacter sp. TaxID=1882438 RepID=UPI0031B08503
MAEQQWLTEKHYLVCPKGVMFKQMKVTSQRQVSFSGHLAATTADTMIGNAFMCMGNLAIAAAPVSALQSKAVAFMVAPGIGLPRVGVPPQLLLFASGQGMVKCNLSAPTRIWIDSSPNLVINHHEGLVVGQSKMLCPSETAMIDAKETFWEAMTSTSHNNVGHIASFAFSFLAGRGLGNMIAAQGGGPAMFNPASLFSNMSVMSRSVNGSAMFSAQADDWNTEEKQNADKLQASGMELTLAIFAAKGSSLTCFPAGTIVHTNNGLLPIEAVTINELLWTANELTGERELKPIKELHRRTTLTMMVVELESGTLFEVTPDHRFLTHGEWREIRELKPTDELENIVGQQVKIKNIESMTRNAVVYNFSVYDNENYFVTDDGILVHNASYTQPVHL